MFKEGYNGLTLSLLRGQELHDAFVPRGRLPKPEAEDNDIDEWIEGWLHLEAREVGACL